MFLDKALAVTLVLGAMSALEGATLEYLSIDDMIVKSTGIVRGRVGASSVSMQGPAGRGTIYTHYSIQVLETLKGAASSTADVAVPGGVAQRIRQTFAGAPTLRPGDEYVFFLWTSRSGLTQIIGLSQGLFTIQSDSGGKMVASRAASSEPMIGANGAPVVDQARSISLADLRARISRSAAGGSK
jgi:hypothetical protein